MDVEYIPLETKDDFICQRSCPSNRKGYYSCQKPESEMEISLSVTQKTGKGLKNK